MLLTQTGKHQQLRCGKQHRSTAQYQHRTDRRRLRQQRDSVALEQIQQLTCGICRKLSDDGGSDIQHGKEGVMPVFRYRLNLPDIQSHRGKGGNQIYYDNTDNKCAKRRIPGQRKQRYQTDYHNIEHMIHGPHDEQIGFPPLHALQKQRRKKLQNTAEGRRHLDIPDENIVRTDRKQQSCEIYPGNQRGDDALRPCGDQIPAASGRTRIRIVNNGLSDNIRRQRGCCSDPAVL